MGYSRKWNAANLELKNESNKKRYRDFPEHALLISARVRAKKRGTPCTITDGDIAIPAVCPVLGIPLVQSRGRLAFNSPSLDCIIPQLGYVPGNVAVISFKANTMKSNATLLELKSLVAWLDKQKSNGITIS